MKTHDMVTAFLRLVRFDDADRVQQGLVSSGKSPTSYFKVWHMVRDPHKTHLWNGMSQRDAGADLLLLKARPSAVDLRAKRLETPRRPCHTPLAPSEVDGMLETLFTDYCFQNNRRGRFMTLGSLLRLLRDAQLLDNQLTTEDLLARVRDLGLGTSVPPGQVVKIPTVSALRSVLTALAHHFFPGHPEEALLEMLSAYVRPFCTQYVAGSVTDELMQEDVSALFTQHEAVLRHIFAHYATLLCSSFAYSNWDTVRRMNLVMSKDEFLLFLRNFNVPISKNEAVRIVRESNHDAEFPGTEPTDLLSYPHFVEALGRLAVALAAHLPRVLSDPAASVSALDVARRWIAGVPVREERRALQARLDARRERLAPHHPADRWGEETAGVEPRRGGGYASSADALLLASKRMAMLQDAVQAREWSMSSDLAALMTLDTAQREAALSSAVAAHCSPAYPLEVTVGDLGRFIAHDLETTVAEAGMLEAAESVVALPEELDRTATRTPGRSSGSLVHGVY